MAEGWPGLRHRLTGLLGLSVLLGALAGGAVGGVTAYFVSRGDDSEPPPPAAQATSTDEAALIAAAQRVMPSVVAVFTEDVPRQDAAGRLIERFSLGSGVIIDAQGYVVTNEHVIRDARRLTVRLANGEERPAQLVGHDAPFTDLAVLRIAAGDLQAIALGDSDALAPGQKVIAMGNSLHDFNSSVTLGVVSGLGRRWYKDGLFMEGLIQTDAAVNPGNSGGALVNAAGQLVGIPTTVVRSDTGVEVEGIAFAIPSSTVARVAGEIIAKGRFDRPYLGVVHQDLRPEVATQLGLILTNGALVTDVSPGSPAAAAGIRRGDVILRIAEFDITPDLPFLNVLGRLRPQQEVAIVIARNGQQVTLDGVILGLRQG
ncbi:MAG: S1C family serine protease [Dehalococcoidia bacterium]